MVRPGAARLWFSGNLQVTNWMTIRALLLLVPALLAATGLVGASPAKRSRQYISIVYEPGTGPVRLFAQEWGEGKPIVLLHGLGASTYSWRKVAPILAATHRVIAIDLKGFGRSAKPNGTKYTARDQARLVSRFLAAHDLQDVTLVGHSFGGTVALALLIGNRVAAHRIQRLVLIDSPTYPQDWPLYAQLLASPAGDELLRAIPPEVIVDVALRQSLKSPSAVSTKDVAAYARPLYSAGALHALAETVRDLLATDFVAASRFYSGIRQPALLVWCRSDPVVPLRTGQLLATALPNAVLKIEDECAHIPPEETPRRLAYWIRDFAH